MHKLIAASTLVVAALLLTSCSETDARVTATSPSPVGVQSGFQTAALEVSPATLFAQPVVSPFCPFTPPFNVGFNLLVRGGGPRLLVTQIRLRFVDTRGVALPTVTLPAPVPMAQFGTQLTLTRDVLAFPLSFGFGCGTLRTGAGRRP
jgi:hypothetical protein